MCVHPGPRPVSILTSGVEAGGFSKGIFCYLPREAVNKMMIVAGGSFCHVRGISKMQLKPAPWLYFFLLLLLPYLCLCVKCDTVNMLTDDNTLLINSFSLAKGRDNLGAFVANCSLCVSVLQLGDQEQHHSALQPVALSEAAKHEWFNKEEV